MSNEDPNRCGDEHGPCSCEPGAGCARGHNINGRLKPKRTSDAWADAFDEYCSGCDGYHKPLEKPV